MSTGWLIAFGVPVLIACVAVFVAARLEHRELCRLQRIPDGRLDARVTRSPL